MRSPALALALVGCSYNPGSFNTLMTGAFVGQRATVGCLDVSLERRKDVEAAPVIGYHFGNRCARPVMIDLSRVAVIGRTETGDEVALSPFDPSMELRPLEIDGRLAGHEALAYPTTTPLVQVCVDAATIATNDGRKESHWMCFASEEPIEPIEMPALDVSDSDHDKSSVDDGEAEALEHEERSL